MAFEMLYQKTTRDNSKLQDLLRQEGSEECIWNLQNRFRVLLRTMEKRTKVVRNIVLTCVVLHNMLRTHQGRADRTSIPTDDMASLQNEQVV